MLKKAPRPSRLAEHTMSQLKTWKILVKTLHIPDECWKFFDFLNSDFFPFLPYSMNKKRRWEVDFLEDLSEVQEGLDEVFQVLFLERTRKGAYDWARYLEHTLPEQFRIRVVHRICDDETSESRKVYKCQKLNSIFGQDFKNFDASGALKNEEKGIVAYNFLGSPQNYMKLFGRKCISEKDNAWPYTTGWIRIRRGKNLLKELRFSVDQEEDDSDDEDLEFENSERGVKCNTRYYNLLEHLVERRRVKKNRC